MADLRGNKSIVYVLWANAVLLVLILLALIARGNSPTFEHQAMAQFQQPIAGGSGIYLMPGQLSHDTWGCYVMDVDRQTLMAYQFNPGEKQLRLIAARNFKFDRQLGNFNTTPPPAEVADLARKEQQVGRVVGANTTPPSPELPSKQLP